MSDSPKNSEKNQLKTHKQKKLSAALIRNMNRRKEAKSTATSNDISVLQRVSSEKLDG